MANVILDRSSYTCHTARRHCYTDILFNKLSVLLLLAQTLFSPSSRLKAYYLDLEQQALIGRSNFCQGCWRADSSRASKAQEGAWDPPEAFRAAWQLVSAAGNCLAPACRERERVLQAQHRTEGCYCKQKDKTNSSNASKAQEGAWDAPEAFRVAGHLLFAAGNCPASVCRQRQRSLHGSTLGSLIFPHKVYFLVPKPSKKGLLFCRYKIFILCRVSWDAETDATAAAAKDD